MNIETVEKSIRNIADFPKQGINFKDVSTAFQNPDVFAFIASEMHAKYLSYGITKVVGIESRGFILGSILANKLHAGFVPIRKAGKLPADTFSKTYDLEYGSDTLEIHKDAISPEDVVLIHDDLLATGGTINAAMDLVRMCGVKKIYASFFVELDFLNGRKNLDSNVPVWSLIHYYK